MAQPRPIVLAICGFYMLRIYHPLRVNKTPVKYHGGRNYTKSVKSQNPDPPLATLATPAVPRDYGAKVAGGGGLPRHLTLAHSRLQDWHGKRLRLALGVLPFEHRAERVREHRRQRCDPKGKTPCRCDDRWPCCILQATNPSTHSVWADCQPCNLIAPCHLATTAETMRRTANHRGSLLHAVCPDA